MGEKELLTLKSWSNGGMGGIEGWGMRGWWCGEEGEVWGMVIWWKNERLGNEEMMV